MLQIKKQGFTISKNISLSKMKMSSKINDMQSLLLKNKSKMDKIRSGDPKLSIKLNRAIECGRSLEPIKISKAALQFKNS